MESFLSRIHNKISIAEGGGKYMVEMRKPIQVAEAIRTYHGEQTRNRNRDDST